MSVMFTRNGFAAAALICAIAAGPASSAQPTEPVRFPHKDLIDRVAKTKSGLAASTLPTGSNAIAIQVRREKSGEVEIHEAHEDIFVAQQGRATVVVGTAEGMTKTAAGEWRGGTLKESRRYELAPGDVLWIPAGLAHQMLLPRGKSFNYLALKFNAPPSR